MSTNQIVCANTEHPHRHITSVGIGGKASAPATRLTVTQVRAAIDKGDTFYTVSPSTGKIALVLKDTCTKGGGCGYRTIRSVADAVTDNNLDNLGACR